MFSVRNFARVLLTNNQITHIPDDAFSGVNITDTDDYYINELDLNGNNLQSISRHAFRGVGSQAFKIYFKNCSLTKFPTEALKEIRLLREISISTNHITDIPDDSFRGYTELYTLVFDKNPIRNLNREALLSGVESTLEMLSLKDMGLIQFPSKLLRNLKAVEWVNLSDNDIEVLHDDMFKGFQTTKQLQVNLERNNINHIAKHALRGTTIKLRKLQLSENQLHSLDFLNQCPPVFQYKWTDLPPQVHVKDNPLNCVCDLLKLANQDNVGVTGTCAQPPPYHGMTLDASRLQSYEETGEFKCPVTDQIDCTSGCDSLMTSSLLTVAYVSIFYVTVEWIA